MRSHDPSKPHHNFAWNLRQLRKIRFITQSQLSAMCGIPRSSIAHFETGAGNPTLENLQKIAEGLGVQIQELISYPASSSRHYPAAKLKSFSRGVDGKAEIIKILPEDIGATEIERFTLSPQSNMLGVPHRSGTREYLYCEKGKILVRVVGEVFEVKEGEVLAFDGHQKHSYENNSTTKAVGFSFIVITSFSRL